MAGKPEYDKTVSTRIVLAALEALGVTAEASGRNDLVVKLPKAIVKSPVRPTMKPLDRGFTHGTLLLNADLSRLANYLNPDKEATGESGITSVRGRVANLVELLPVLRTSRSARRLKRPFRLLRRARRRGSDFAR